MWQAILSVFIGSGIGGVMRYLAAVGMQTVLGDSQQWMLPWSTMAVNLIGSFCFGLIFGLGMSGTVSREWRLALTTGFCGGLTTFSTFSFETLTMLSGGQIISGLATLSCRLQEASLPPWPDTCLPVSAQRITLPFLLQVVH